MKISSFFKPLSFLPALALMYMIYTFSAQPGESSSSLSFTVSKKIVQAIDMVTQQNWEDWQIEQHANQIHGIVRKGAHITEYFLLAIAVSFPLYVYGVRGIFLMLLAGIICVGYACSDEFHQSMVSGRSPSPRDVMIDSIGIFAGVILTRLIGWSGRMAITGPAYERRQKKQQKELDAREEQLRRREAALRREERRYRDANAARARDDRRYRKENAAARRDDRRYQQDHAQAARRDERLYQQDHVQAIRRNERRALDESGSHSSELNYREGSTAPQVRQQHYGDGKVSTTIHQRGYFDEAGSAISHEAQYSDRSTSSAARDVQYADRSSSSAAHDAQYADRNASSAARDGQYTDRSTSSAARDVQYADRSNSPTSGSVPGDRTIVLGTEHEVDDRTRVYRTEQQQKRMDEAYRRQVYERRRVQSEDLQDDSTSDQLSEDLPFSHLLGKKKKTGK